MMPVANALHVKVVGRQWCWEVQYAAGGPRAAFTTANELHVPVGRPVIVEVEAADAIHTFRIPNLHGKEDMIRADRRPSRSVQIERGISWSVRGVLRCYTWKPRCAR